MVEPIGQASAAVSIFDKIKSFIGPTKLSIVWIDQEWIDGQLVHHYRMKVTKPKWSKSASKSPIELHVPKNINLAEFDINLPGIQIEPMRIPASKLTVTSHELIGNYLNNLYDDQEIPVSLRLPCPWEEVLERDESMQENQKTYYYANNNDFPVKSCDIEHSMLLTDQIREIEVIKQGVVISQHRLIKLSKTFFVDFEAGKIQTYFPKGISKSDDSWLKKRDKTDPNCIGNRTESNCILRFTFDLEPHDKIEIRLHLS